MQPMSRRTQPQVPVSAGARALPRPCMPGLSVKGPPAGELLGFGAIWGKQKPFLHFFVLDEGGRVKLDVPIDVPEPIFVHDMAITKVCNSA